MSISQAGGMMEQAVQEVTRMMAACHRFKDVEAFIEGCVWLNEEERSALWLIAWNGGEPVVARRVGRAVR